MPFAVLAQPVAGDDNSATDEETSVNISVLTNDAAGLDPIDPATVDLDVGTIAIDNSFLTAAGQFTVDPLGVVTFLPALNFTGNALLNYTVADINGATSNQALITVVVSGVNDAPIFTAGGNQTDNEDAGAQSVAGWATGISDGDAEFVQTLSFNVSNDNNALFSVQPAVSAAGTLTYTPAANAAGVANVTITLSDNGSGVSPNVNTSAAHAFVITIDPLNDAPVFTKGADQTDNEDPGPQTIAGWATGISDGDPESVQTLTFNVTNDNNGLFSVQPAISAAGILTYTPAANANGTANVTVILSDNGSAVAPNVNTSAAQSFVIDVNAVNDAPSFTPGANETTTEDAGAQTINGWATGVTDGDPELVQTLSFNVSNDNNALFSVQPAISSAGNLTYTPSPGINGVATVTVSLSDNGSGVAPNVNTSAPQVFTISVNSVNDAPVFVKGADQVVNEDAATQTIAGWATGISDGDPELTQTLTFNVSNDNNALFSTQPAITAAGTLSYTPAANANGSATVTVTLSDNGSGILPNVNTSAAQTFTIDINAVNDVPVFAKGSNQTVNENAGAQTTTGWATGISDGDPDLSQTLTFNVSNDNNSLFSVQPAINAAGTLTYTPAADQNGTAVVTITLSDNGSGVAPNVNTSAAQTFNITVNQINDAPFFTKGADESVNEDAGLQTVAGWATGINDGDPDLVQTLTFSVSNDNNALFSVQPTLTPTGTLSYTPAANANGTATVTVILSDNGSGVAPNVNTSPAQNFSITINPVNDAPTISVISNQTINEDNTTGNVAFTIGDIETAAGSLVVTATSSNTTLVPNGNITLGGAGPSRTINVAPAADLSGVTTITVNVSDGTQTTPRTFTVTVNSVNDAPTISAIADQSIAEDTPTGAIAFTVGDVETAAGSLTITPSSGNTTLIPIANIVLGGSGASRTVTITPADNQNGVTVITLSVDDGTTSTDTDFQITVTGVNDPPTVSAISDRTINEDAQTGNINFTVSDPESAASTLIVTGTSGNTTLVPDANIILGGTGAARTVNIIPAANQFGVVTITLNVSDGTNSTPRTFDVTVTPVNDAPVIISQVPITVNEVQPVVVSLSQLTVTDPDNNFPGDFTLSILAGANYTVAGTTVTPFPNFSGTLTVPLFVSDGAAFSPIFNLQISVNSTNDAPVITGQQTLTINEDQPITLELSNLTVNDPDDTYPDDFTLTVLAGSNYTFSNNTVTPALNYNGTLSVSVKVNDGDVDSAPYNVQITITPVNDPPVITAQSALTTPEDTPLTLVVGNFTVTDPEPTSYTLSVSQTPGPNYSVSGNIITPDLNFSGTLTVPVTVSDGMLNSATFNAQVQVTAVNDAPVITAHVPLTTVEDTPITLVLANFTVTDVDNTFPTGFSLSVQSGTNYTFSGNTVTPALDFTGTISVNVTVSDGTTNSAPFPVEIEVTPASDAPVITGQNPVSLNEDQTRAISKSDLIYEDSDTPDGQLTLSVTGGTNYTVTGNTISPSANFFGTLSVNVRIYDGVDYSNTFQLQVTVVPVNDPPLMNTLPNLTILEDAAQQTVTVTGISPGPLESQPLLLSVSSSVPSLIPDPTVTPVYNGTAATATFTFKPEPNTFGTSVITVKVIDPDFVDYTVTFTVTVTSINDAPTLSAISVDPIIEDAPEQIIPLSGITAGGGIAESGQVLTVIPSTDMPELFEIFKEEYTSPATSGSLRIKPKANANGTAQITVRVQDDGTPTPAPNVNFTTRTFTLVITAVNDPPVFISEAETITEPGKPYEYAIDVIDVDGEVITLTAVTKPAWLTFTLGTNGKATLSGTPTAGVSGDFTVVLEAKDPSGTPILQEFTITVNSRPVLSPVTITLNEDEPHTFSSADFAPGFSDGDANPIAELQITQLPIRGVLRLNNNPVSAGDKIAQADLAGLVYTPLQDSTEPDTLYWNASDGFLFYALTDTYAKLNILSLNDAPVITAFEPETDTLKYEFGSEFPVALTTLFDGYDPDNDNITSAEIGFKRIGIYQYKAENDVLVFQSTAKITGDYDEAGGVLTLSGPATAAEYVEAIRSIKYNHVDARELFKENEKIRSISVAFSDSKGATSQQQERIVELIYTFSDLNIPTAFTPNAGDDQGDNVNQNWVISSPNGTEQYSNAEIKIYNKNGLLLYEAKGFENPWNGVWNGEVLPSDTYFYTIDLNYNKVRYKGTVTLLR